LSSSELSSQFELVLFCFWWNLVWHPMGDMKDFFEIRLIVRQLSPVAPCMLFSQFRLLLANYREDIRMSALRSVSRNLRFVNISPDFSLCLALRSALWTIITCRSSYWIFTDWIQLMQLLDA
jgi:hypothetical protein